MHALLSALVVITSIAHTTPPYHQVAFVLAIILFTLVFCHYTSLTRPPRPPHPPHLHMHYLVPRLFNQRPIATMPVLTKRRRAEMEATAEGRAELEAEANLQLPTSKRRRTISPKQGTKTKEQATQQTPTNHQRASSIIGSGSASSAKAQPDEQVEVDTQLQAEQEAYSRHVSSVQPAEHEPDDNKRDPVAEASSVSDLRPTKSQHGQETPTSSGQMETSTVTPSKETPSNQAPTKHKHKAIVEESSEDDHHEPNSAGARFIMTKLLLEHT
ncbi:hypothetical protein F4820DRAFT_441976, partial [Hypoxylon rubiginosum]